MGLFQLSAPSSAPMTVKPLNAAEQAWLKKAQQLFDSAPARFEYLTIGDADLVVIDKDGAKHSNLCDGAAERDGIVLGAIRTKGRVHGVSG